MGQAAASMIEVLVSVAIMGLMFVSLYSGISAGFAIVQLARENLRATQILQEKMETIRLYRWDQINTPGFIPTNFIDYFFATENERSSLIYTGTVRIGSIALTESYSNDLRAVEIELSWMSVGKRRVRGMSTFVSRYGLQNYVY